MALVVGAKSIAHQVEKTTTYKAIPWSMYLLPTNDDLYGVVVKTNTSRVLAVVTLRV